LGRLKVTHCACIQQQPLPRRSNTGESSLLKKTLKISAAIAVITVVAVLIAFLRWRDQQARRLQKNSRVSETTQGPVEYVLSGKGPAVLILHGTIGGYDQAQMIAEMLGTDAYQFVAVSRPGYLRTPLSTGDTFEAQADAYAALLDQLGIDRVAVIAVSGGGPSALQFALRYPERCWGLVMLSANSDVRAGADNTSDSQPAASTGRPLELILNAIFSDFTSWIVVGLAKLMPRTFLDNLVGVTYTAEIMNNPAQFELYIETVNSFALLSQRRAGSFNDGSQFTQFTGYSFEDITAPVLILQGNKDAASIIAQQQYIDDIIPNSTYIEIDGGTHFMALSHRSMLAPLILDFLKTNAP
jgi:pimeloyl-ACP methyl ester carboxylesterase